MKKEAAPLGLGLHAGPEINKTGLAGKVTPRKHLLGFDPIQQTKSNCTESCYCIN